MTKPGATERVRVPLLRPFTPMEFLITELMAVDLMNGVAIAEALHVSHHTVRKHIFRAARKIPSDLPAQMRLVAWYRGATRDVLAWSDGAGSPNAPSAPSAFRGGS